MGQHPVVLRRRLPGLTQQPMQRNHVRDHKQRHRIGSAQAAPNCPATDGRLAWMSW